MNTWTTIRWELEHWSVQCGIETLKTKSHQAQNLLIKLNLMSCDLPNNGSILIYLVKKVIDNLYIFLIGLLVNRVKRQSQIARITCKQSYTSIHDDSEIHQLCYMTSLFCFRIARINSVKIFFAYDNLTIDSHRKSLNKGIKIVRQPSPGTI